MPTQRTRAPRQKRYRESLAWYDSDSGASLSGTLHSANPAGERVTSFRSHPVLRHKAKIPATLPGMKLLSADAGAPLPEL
jgi:hypothetical protein